ncbi:MAG: heme-binding domain-containing protein [Draconibacterium sp.]|nr:heme-binding domain-containing protein [Draconibacterium sp.]
MRLIIKILVVIGIVTFIVIQFFQPEKNISEITQNHIFKQEQLPENVHQTLKNACMDCHSNNTNYPWYNKIAPVSWMLDKHVTEGKDELNFSEWGEMDAYDKIGALEDIRQEVERKTMPLKEYAALHKEAKLTDEQRAALIAWIDKRGVELVKSSSE